MYKINKDQSLEIVDKYLNGQNIKSLAEEYNCDTSNIYLHLKKHNIKPRGKINKLTKYKDEIINLYVNELKTIVDIANIYDTVDTYIFKFLKKHNLEIRGNRKNFFNEDYFQNIDSNDKAYWLGFLCADGGMTKNKRHMKLLLSKKDEVVIHKFIENLDYKGNTIKSERIYNNKLLLNVGICLNSIKLCNDLCNYGCGPQKTFTLRYPQNLDDKYFWHFLRGYFDGDGNMYYDKRFKANWSIISNVDFCKDIQKKLKQFGFESFIYINSGKNQNIAELRIMKQEDVHLLFEKLYENSKFHLERKYNKFVEYIEYHKSKKIKKENKREKKLELQLKIKKLREENLTLKKIAEKLNTTENIVNNLLYAFK